jgi:hypothetical protein
MLAFLFFSGIFGGALYFLLKDHRRFFPKWYGREFLRPETWSRH